MSNIYLQVNGGKQLSLTLTAFTWGPRAFITCKGYTQEKSVTFDLVSPSIADMVTELRLVADTLEAKATAEEIDQIQQRQAVEGHKYTGSIQASDLIASMPVARKLELLIERYRETLPDIAEALIQDYKAFTGQTYKGETMTTNQLARDLAQLKPLYHTLLHRDGTVNRSAVARALGVKAGGASWQRVVDVAAALDSTSSSSSSGEEAGNVTEWVRKAA